MSTPRADMTRGGPAAPASWRASRAVTVN